MPYHLRPVRTIRVHCPIIEATFRALIGGRLGAIETDPVAAPILSLIRADNELGDFGLYKGVFEVSLGFEGFTPTPEANPTLGEGDSNSLSPTAVIKTFVDEAVAEGRLLELLSALADLHPWQIPVIEVSGRDGVRLFQPN